MKLTLVIVRSPDSSLPLRMTDGGTDATTSDHTQGGPIHTDPLTARFNTHHIRKIS